MMYNLSLNSFILPTFDVIIPLIEDETSSIVLTTLLKSPLTIVEVLR